MGRMTEQPEQSSDDVTMTRFKGLLYAAIAMAIVPIIALLILLIADPRQDTDPYNALGGIAAFTGIATGLLFGATAIYAQVKGLWNRAPKGLRYTSWALLAALAIFAIVNGAAQN